ncbi:ArsR family transcriptional regulator [Opitutaceae bacterium TAV5]|nr:ArsR family transcriptional regulator [Opitutaceae bacterium TAV5]
MVDIFGRAARVAGIPPSVGKIYGVLFSSALPLCLQQIADRLDLGKGSVSQGLRVLRSWGIICLAKQQHDKRRIYFEPAPEGRQLIDRILTDRLLPGLEKWNAAINTLAGYGDPSRRGSHRTDQAMIEERLQTLRTWPGQIRTPVTAAIRPRT